MDEPAGEPASEPLLELRAVMAVLRAECPWKAEQTHHSLAPYLLEETLETLEVIEQAGDPDDPDHPDGLDDAHLCEELGDVLLQVYFHAAVAAERGAFDIDDVARGLAAKLRRRNPHVFGTPEQRAAGAGLSAAEVDAQWEAVKRAGG